MQRIPPVTAETETPKQKAVRDKARAAWGQSLNITETMAHNPAVLEGFLAFWTALDKSGLSHEDREVICMDMAVQNGCHYCVPAHLDMAAARKIDMDMITRISKGELLSGDSRAAHLQRLTRRLVETGGKLEDTELAQAHSDGFDNSQLVAIIAEIAHCHFTNSFNRLANTTPDAHYPNL
jgi:uncharacterized peroxidase-related enzyme